MISKKFLVVISCLLFASCAEDKKTIGTPGRFSPPGSEFTLTPNLSSAALGALVSTQSFPLQQEDLLIRDPEILKILSDLSNGEFVNSLQTGVQGNFEWLKLNEHGLHLQLSASEENVLLEVWKRNPFIYTRSFSRGSRVDTVSKTRYGIVNFVYRSDCSNTVYKSIFDHGRENSVVKTGSGAPCDGLSFYREKDVPKLVDRLRNLEDLNEEKQSLNPQLEAFYETL